MRKLLLVAVTLLFTTTVVHAQGNSITWNFSLGGFGNFTRFGTQLAQFPEIGFFPSPIFSRTVYIGRCTGSPFQPNCSGILFEATESIHPDPASPDQIEVNGTLSRLGAGDSVFGNYVCHNSTHMGVRTWGLECQVTITGGRGAYLNSTGTGFMQRTLQLFPVNSLSVVEVSNWQGSVTFSPNP